MVCVLFYVIGIVELLVSSAICRLQGLSYSHGPECIVSFILFIHHNIHFYFELCTYCNILDIYLLWNINSVKYILFYMELLNYLFCDMFGGILECYELTHISWSSTPRPHKGSYAWVSRHCYPIGCVIKSTHQGICSCSPIVNFLEVTFYHGMVTSVIFLIKK